MVNIVPINDLEEHVLDNTCKCEPFVKFNDGEMFVVHSAFDEREILEELVGECSDGWAIIENT